MPRKTALLFLLASLALFPVVAAPLRIGVFIPGIREGSPTYEDLAKGAERFVSEIDQIIAETSDQNSHPSH